MCLKRLTKSQTFTITAPCGLVERACALFTDQASFTRRPFCRAITNGDHKVKIAHRDASLQNEIIEKKICDLFIFVLNGATSTMQCCWAPIQVSTTELKTVSVSRGDLSWPATWSVRVFLPVTATLACNLVSLFKILIKMQHWQLPTDKAVTHSPGRGHASKYTK